jgi:site-specific DNA-methyltransferase (adenine-specific)
MKELRLLNGDCLDKLKELDNNSIDSIVTDPPYGLSFMGKKWDYDVPSVEIWQECLRVLKPGGHLLAFAGSRTYHRMAVRIEDAGFDIRDQIMWIYGSGFPKSHNVGNAIDKKHGAANRGHAISSGNQLHPTTGLARANGEQLDKYEARTEEGKGWEGWGTALKPAHEPIVMARKPIEGTVAENTLQYGVGGLNIDATRVGYVDDYDKKHQEDIRKGTGTFFGGNGESVCEQTDMQGRWPANVILDEEAGQILDEQSGIRKGFASQNCNNQKLYGGNALNQSTTTRDGFKEGYNDEGGASRFFYCPKASKKDRDEAITSDAKQMAHGLGDTCKICGCRFVGNPEQLCKCDNPIRIHAERKNTHPTVKPTDLMKYLIRLVTPKDGIVLDPFMGSGSTGKAAMQEGMWFVGIEREREYFEIAKQRIEYEADKRKFW